MRKINNKLDCESYFLRNGFDQKIAAISPETIHRNGKKTHCTDSTLQKWGVLFFLGECGQNNYSQTCFEL